MEKLIPVTKVALITGITGQDGAYLAEYLLNKGYIVHGIKRRSSSFNTQRIDHLYKDRHEKGARLFLHYGDITDSTCLIRIIQDCQPDEIYNLAAMSHVHISFEIPDYTGNTDALGIIRILDAVRLLGLVNKTKIYQASTSELYGKAQEIPQTETTPFYPRSPYASAKLYAYWIVVNYREAYNMFACNGILFNHESPLRGENFVTRKITRAAAKIALNLEKVLYLGNLNAVRDWGHAKDFVAAMHAMLQQPTPEDFVIATGIPKTVREFVTSAFHELGLTLEFSGTGIDERGVIVNINHAQFESIVGLNASHLRIGQVIVVVTSEYFRPNEVDYLLGNPDKAKRVLGWQANYNFNDLVSEMVRADVKNFLRDKLLVDHGHEFYSSDELEKIAYA